MECYNMPYNRAMARLTPDERIVVRKFNRIHHEEMQKHLETNRL